MKNTTHTFMTLGLPNIMWDGGNPNAQGVTTMIVVRWIDYPSVPNMFGGRGKTECSIFHSDMFGLGLAARSWANCSSHDSFDPIYGREISLARVMRKIRKQQSRHERGPMRVVGNMLESTTVRKTMWWLFFDKNGFETRKNHVFGDVEHPAPFTKPVSPPPEPCRYDPGKDGPSKVFPLAAPAAGRGAPIECCDSTTATTEGDTGTSKYDPVNDGPPKDFPLGPLSFKDLYIAKPIMPTVSLSDAAIWRKHGMETGDARRAAHEAERQAILRHLDQFPEELHHDDMLGKPDEEENSPVTLAHALRFRRARTAGLRKDSPTPE